MKIFRIVFVLMLLLSTTEIYSQLSAPDPEAVYGGRINAVSIIQTSGSTSQIFISTESANSIFYADVTTSGSPVFSAFTVMPGVGADDGYGSGIRTMAADANSGFLFFINNINLYSTHYSSSTVNTIYSGGVSGMTVYGGYLFFTEADHLRWGSINSTTGAFTEDVNSPLTMPSALGTAQLVVNPSNLKLYLTDTGVSPMTLFKSSSDYNALNGATTFGTLSTGSLVGAIVWNGFGCGLDGTIMYNGDTGGEKKVTHSTDDGSSWTTTSTGLSGVSGPNFAFQTSGSDYIVYFAKCYATFNAATKAFGSWAEFGNTGMETHPNDGVVAADPTNTSIVYLTTDQGIGSSINGGATIFEIDDGVEAVQVKDFDMNSAKSDAWLAAKSGIRYVSGYGSTPVWSTAIFPNGDGSPYYSAEMVKNNPYSAYVGNLRVYKTQNKGDTWTQVFTAESAPYNYPGVGSRVEAIEVFSGDTNLVVCGYTIEEPSDSDSLQGGFFYSTDGGSSWNQQLLKASSGVYDADVNDIIFTTEGGSPVAYIGVTYDLSIAISTRARSVYRAEWNGSSWSVRNDFDGSYTSTGSPITATIIDMHVTQTGDTLLACGTDAGTNHPILYYKILSGANLWTPFTTTGFPSSAGKAGKAVSFGNDTVYCAVDNEIYMMHFSGTSWTTGYTYPVGTEINVLYFDDLLVGTGTGIYGQKNDANLPVEMISFTSSVLDDNVILNWATATEINNYGFEIQRSAYSDQRTAEWENIGFVKGSGNSMRINQYTFVDKPKERESVKYRLKQIDNDGSFKYSNTVEVSFNLPVEFKLEQNYPNPFNPATKIRYSIPLVETQSSAAAQNVLLKVYDMLGNEIATLVNEKKPAGVYEINFDASKLSSGIYLYKLQAGSFVQTKKMMLLK